VDFTLLVVLSFNKFVFNFIKGNPFFDVTFFRGIFFLGMAISHFQSVEEKRRASSNRMEIQDNGRTSVSGKRKHCH